MIPSLQTLDSYTAWKHPEFLKTFALSEEFRYELAGHLFPDCDLTKKGTRLSFSFEYTEDSDIHLCLESDSAYFRESGRIKLLPLLTPVILHNCIAAHPNRAYLYVYRELPKHWGSKGVDVLELFARTNGSALYQSILLNPSSMVADDLEAFYYKSEYEI